MKLTPLAELEDFQLVDSDQDCRGWPVLDAAGQPVGTVRDMLVDTDTDTDTDADAERVAALVLDSGARVPAGAISFKDGTVLLDSAYGLVSGLSPTSYSHRSVVPVVE